jgi:uncharacterized membrane protein YccC
MRDDDSNNEESPLNRVGTAVAALPALLAALVLWGIPVEIPVLVLVVVVAVCGLVGGAINMYDRGPLVAGAALGLVMALGGFAAVYFWIQGRQRVRGFEVAIAFLIGIAPGFAFQFFIKRLIASRAEEKRQAKIRKRKRSIRRQERLDDESTPRSASPPGPSLGGQDTHVSACGRSPTPMGRTILLPVPHDRPPVP